ncbi:choice-of-anchor P family protein [Aeromicrobium sp.]|uniref:choice-of-anchor P family protein n=1 Tax=Aeromicrobium sp. TaxID=1871063 RepID=UPI002FC65DA5
MKTRLRTLTVAAVVALSTVSLQGLPQASAATDTFAFGVSAGGTRISAVGTTVTSDLTAESSLIGRSPASTSNQVASVRVGTLAQVGAVNTDAAAVSSGNGFATTAHARTANISLLNGAIKASAVDTTSKAESKSDVTPTASNHTEFVGLTIAGKKYPVNVPANTGVTIPGLAQVTLNASSIEIDGETVVGQGAGLYVTLLKAFNGVAAGAVIVLNPTYAVVVPTTDQDGGLQLGGGGQGAYAYAHVGDEVEAETGQIGRKTMPPRGTNGQTLSNTTAKVNVQGLLTAKAIESTVNGTSVPALSEATATSTITELRLFPSLLSSGVITATAIGSKSHVRVDDGTPVTEGSLQFINLKIAGKAIPVDVAPNTTLHVAGLGKVVINEQKEIRAPGFGHAFRVIALHITLDTARAGLPVGAEIELGHSYAVAFG